MLTLSRKINEALLIADYRVSVKEIKCSEATCILNIMRVMAEDELGIATTVKLTTDGTFDMATLPFGPQATLRARPNSNFQASISIEAPRNILIIREELLNSEAHKTLTNRCND